MTAPPAYSFHNRKLAQEFQAQQREILFDVKSGLRVVLPFCAKDAALMARNLAALAVLHPLLKRTAILHYDGSPSAAAIQNISALARRVFQSVMVSVYPTPTGSWTGWPAACNWSFLRACRFIESHNLGSWLWLEPDAVALTPDWLARIEREYALGRKPFMGTLFPHHAHINGVAVYPQNVLAYSPKVAEVQKEAWDYACGFEMVKHAHNAKHLIQHADNGNSRGPSDFTSKNLNFINQSTVLYHPVKNGSLFGLLPRPAPKTSILIVSHAKDFSWLRWCLRSIEKFAAGFHETVVVLPDNNHKPDFIGSVRLLQAREWAGNGMMWHQWIKMTADHVCPEADYILHMDSDCIFSETVKPDAYFHNGKPILLHATYDWVERKFRNPAHRHWQKNVQACLGGEVTMEFMRRHPAVHPRQIYGLARLMIGMRVGREMTDYLMSLNSKFPQDFSEFNTLGEVAWRHLHNQYHWVNQETDGRPHDKLIEFWSHAPIDKPQELTWTDAPMRKFVPIEVIRKTLGISENRLLDVVGQNPNIKTP